jgi:hypothetical protein
MPNNPNKQTLTNLKNPREYIGDQYILCTFPLMMRGIPLVLESSNDLAEVYKAIPEHLSEDERTLSICEVPKSIWITSKSDPTDSNPVAVRTLSEVEFHATCSEEDEED